MTRSKKTSKPRVLVAMSGGVDSSVAAALLLKAGFEVTGAYMKQWSDTADLVGVCSWKTDRRDALRVAAHLGIPLLTWDFEKEYKEEVIQYMFEEYEALRTPNPDVMCNVFIKFGAWLKKAKAEGFDYLATGHYASLHISKTIELVEAKDDNKDQTYFLHQLSQEQLRHTLFPLGRYTKPEVRALAKRFGLPTAEREESMGICFVGEVPIKEFLAQRIAPTPGNIITPDGTVIGTHQGLSFYTIGERHVGVQSGKKGEQRTPLYVMEKRKKTNELVVTHAEDTKRARKEIVLPRVSWVSGQPPQFPLQCEVRLRHRGEKKKVTITSAKEGVVVTFKNPEHSITPGQFVVFYKKNVCLGGGAIQS